MWCFRRAPTAATTALSSAPLHSLDSQPCPAHVSHMSICMFVCMCVGVLEQAPRVGTCVRVLLMTVSCVGVRVCVHFQKSGWARGPRSVVPSHTAMNGMHIVVLIEWC